KELESELEQVRKEKDSAVLSQEFEKAASFRDKEQKTKEKLEATETKWKEKQGKENLSVGEEDIDAVVSTWQADTLEKIKKKKRITKYKVKNYKNMFLTARNNRKRKKNKKKPKTNRKKIKTKKIFH